MLYAITVLFICGTTPEANQLGSVSLNVNNLGPSMDTLYTNVLYKEMQFHESAPTNLQGTRRNNMK